MDNKILAALVKVLKKLRKVCDQASFIIKQKSAKESQKKKFQMKNEFRLKLKI